MRDAERQDKDHDMEGRTRPRAEPHPPPSQAALAVVTPARVLMAVRAGDLARMGGAASARAAHTLLLAGRL